MEVRKIAAPAESQKKAQLFLLESLTKLELLTFIWESNASPRAAVARRLMYSFRDTAFVEINIVVIWNKTKQKSTWVLR